jgi:DNA-binding response OmpR family regulator
MNTTKHHKTVLLVEDDMYIADIIQEKLRSKGYNLVYMEDGEKASVFFDEAEKAGEIDIVLLDLLLPKVHGFEVLKKIKQNPRTAGIPVLILSNVGDKKEIEEGLQLGAIDYLIKSNYTPDEIAQRIDNIVDLSSKIKNAD